MRAGPKQTWGFAFMTNQRRGHQKTPQWLAKQVPDSIVVRTSAPHAENPGSIPGRGGGMLLHPPMPSPCPAPQSPLPATSSLFLPPMASSMRPLCLLVTLPAHNPIYGTSLWSNLFTPKEVFTVFFFLILVLEMMFKGGCTHSDWLAAPIQKKN